jgi:uncharacterized protein (DUF885 family)
MKTSLTIAISLTLSGIASAYAPAEIAAESKKANDFFENCWDETLSRHPVDESFYGIKTHYDQLEDLSDEKAASDEKVWERQLADLKKNIKFEALDAQTQLSYKLFEREAAREAEEFKYRFDIYPVSQMRGVHAQVPTFMINIHKIDDVKDAEAYIARLRAFPKLFDQMLVNLKGR